MSVTPPVPERPPVPITVYVRDPNRARVAQADEQTVLDCILRFNDLSTWTLTLPTGSAAASAITVPGAGIVVRRGDHVMLSGPVLQTERVWDAETDVIVAGGVDDMAALDDRLALPVPEGPPYDTRAYDTRSGAAESVMLAYITANAGPGAVLARQVAGLTLAPDQARGSSVVESVRYDQLLEVLHRISLKGGGLGFRVTQEGAALMVTVYQPQDRSNEAVFSRDLGNLRGYRYKVAAPEATHIYGAGGGEGTARLIVEGGNAAAEAAWQRRVEHFRDRRDTTDPTEITQTINKELAEAGPATALSITPIDTGALRFGEHYGLGDRVTVVIDGQPITDIVREVRLALNAEGESIEPVVGSPLAIEDMFGLVTRLRSQDRRISGLEQRR